ncbi:MAG: hypothetical protein KDI04_03200 [Halieaceae bacterium]|nr:hypothetical protein [Halieaceae bacterium]MCP5167864.1 hypothetical protein [Pseudomonadales bacterium]MCP5188647.1 hypothetical protein [Pseudomonadales bacterium]
MSTSQSTSLLPALLANIDEEQPLSVLHIGPALPETLDFFSGYRCKLHFIDLFAELPGLQVGDDSEVPPAALLAELLQWPAGTRIDLCLFWDLFNYLEGAVIRDLLTLLRPHLHSTSHGHCFAVHNLKTPQHAQVYGIRDTDQISVRGRPAPLPGYHPHTQGQLEKWLTGLRVSRSVLLADSRLEILLQVASPQR